MLWYSTHSAEGNEVVASEIYDDDALLEFPQSGERFRGKDNFIPWRSEYPATQLEFEVRAIRGEGDTWILEGHARYDGGDPNPFVDVLHFRGGLVDRETIYVTEPFLQTKLEHSSPRLLDLKQLRDCPYEFEAASESWRRVPDWRAAGAWLTYDLPGAGDGNRTRTVSLGNC